MSSARRAILLMAAFGLSWASVELLAPFLSRPYSAYQVVWSRYATHLAFMLAVWGWREPRSLWRTQRPAYQIGRSLLMIAMPASFIISLQQGIDIGVILCILWTCPLLMLGMARLYLGERAPAPVWVAAFAATTGACIAAAPGPLPRAALILFPVAMAVSFSAYVVMTRSLRTETTRANLFYTALGVFIPLSFVMPRVWVTPTPRDFLVLAAIGLIGYGGLLAVDRMTAIAPVSASAPVSPLQFVFSAGIAAALGAQHPGKRVALGCAIVVASALYLWARAPMPLTQEAA